MFNSIGLYVCFYASNTGFDYCSFRVSFEIRKCESPALFLFFKVVLVIQGLLRLPINFRIDFFLISVQKAIRTWIGIALNLEATLDNTDVLTILSLLSYESEMYFHLFSSLIS